MNIRLCKTKLSIFFILCGGLYAESLEMHRDRAPLEATYNLEKTTYFTSVEYIYFVPYQAGLILAESGILPDPDTLPPAKYPVPAFNGKSGFRLALGTENFHDGWKLLAKYFWWNNTPSIKANILTEGYPLYFPFYLDIDDIVDAISSKFNNIFQRFDVILDRPFFVSEYVSLNPYIGVMIPFESQSFWVDGEDIGSDRTTESRFKSKWWGIGPYTGFNVEYYFLKELALFARPGASILYAGHHITNKIDSVNEDGSVETIINNSYVVINGIEPVLELSLGLCYKHSWRNYQLDVHLGWEVQDYFFHSAYLQTGNNNFLLGNYVMQGAVAGLTFHF